MNRLLTTMACAIVGLLLSIALYALIPPSAQAATTLGDAQKVPPGYLGDTWTAYPLCWVYYSGYTRNGPGCPGNDKNAPFSSAIFSINNVDTPTVGRSVYLTSAWNGGYGAGITVGKAFNSPGCPTNYQYDKVNFRCLNPNNGRTAVLSYCYGNGTLVTDVNGQVIDIVITGPQQYALPSGYSSANEDKIDIDAYGTYANQTAYRDWQSEFGYVADCHAFKAGILDTTTTAVGPAPAVQVGTQMKLQWSCLPYRYVNWEQKVDTGIGSQGYWVSGIVYAFDPLFTSVSGSGQNFVLNSSTLFGSQTITAPVTAGTYNYTLTCSGPKNLPVMTIAVSVTATPPPPDSCPIAAESLSANTLVLYSGATRRINAQGRSFCAVNTSTIHYLIPAKSTAEVDAFSAKAPYISGLTIF